MGFHDIVFPVSVAFGSTGGPERRTEIITLGSGREERNSPWAGSRRRYDAGLGLNSLDDLHGVIAFFEARQGRLHGFRWKDHLDFKSCRPSEAISPMDETLGEGDGLRVSYPLTKTYWDAAGRYERRISKPVIGSVRVAVNGVELTSADFTLSADGIVTLTHAAASGALVTARFRFDVPVRFDTDRLSINLAAFQAGEVPSIPIVEILP
jgi:uncharacterized protein (TIGR02217 family)